jgi:hypothetical protein
LVELYLRSVGAAQGKQVDMLFGWPKAETRKAVEAVVAAGAATCDVSVPEHGEGWLALTDLLE